MQKKAVQKKAAPKRQPRRLAGITRATTSNVASSVTAVTLAADNGNRRGFIIHNDSTATLFIKYGSGALATSYTYKAAAGVHWEMQDYAVYTGIITGIWDVANGNARVTELD